MSYKNHIITCLETSEINNITHNSSIYIEHLTLRFSKINNLKILRFETPLMHLILSKETVYYLLALEFSVNLIAKESQNIVSIVDKKYMNFINMIINVKDPFVAYNIIRDNNSFDKNNLIDCELLAYIFALV